MKIKRGYKTKRTYRIRCHSGIMGWRTRLRNNYSSFEDWEQYSDMWGLCLQLGYGTAKIAWDANPVIEGSIKAGDFRKVA